jgi:hypothetical protein
MLEIVFVREDLQSVVCPRLVHHRARKTRGTEATEDTFAPDRRRGPVVGPSPIVVARLSDGQQRPVDLPAQKRQATTGLVFFNVIQHRTTLKQPPALRATTATYADQEIVSQLRLLRRSSPSTATYCWWWLPRATLQRSKRVCERTRSGHERRRRHRQAITIEARIKLFVFKKV